jgi:ethanolamine ammonia-lyase small subunit
MSRDDVDPWAAWRRHTAARIGLGRAGVSLPTEALLRFGVAHAQARDAVHLPFDAAMLRQELAALGLDALEVESAAPDRATYLRRPDLGRRLGERSVALLQAQPPQPGTLAVVIGDGLSAKAVHHHAVPLLRALLPLLDDAGIRCGTTVLAHQARVALGDPIGEALQAQAVLVLIGERPGLSSPDSLGAYLSWAPRVGLNDAQRNCVSNIRPAGLAIPHAARTIAWLLGAARRLGATGIALKDESERTPLDAAPAAVRIGAAGSGDAG